jgi:RHS repeat-associated protein
VSSGGTVTYLHHDQQGSTRLLTSSSGEVVGKCSYGAYGSPGCEGSEKTPLGYDGQYTNADTGLVYLRAREYDPATGQFMSVDPLEAITGAPYSYAGDDPLNAGDATGLFSIGEIPVVGEALEKGATRFVGFWDGFTSPVFGGTAALRSALGLNGGLNQCSREYQLANEIGGYDLDAEAVAPVAYAGGTGAGLIFGSIGSEGAAEATGNLLTDIATRLPDAEIAKLRAALFTLAGTGTVGYAEVRGLQALSPAEPGTSACGCA